MAYSQHIKDMERASVTSLQDNIGTERQDHDIFTHTMALKIRLNDRTLEVKVKPFKSFVVIIYDCAVWKNYIKRIQRRKPEVTTTDALKPKSATNGHTVPGLLSGNQTAEI
jgi:hypothetical protein